jgi:hypothetical protein
LLLAAEIGHTYEVQPGYFFALNEVTTTYIEAN